MSLPIFPATLQFLLESGSTLALIDVREIGEYNAAHIPRASLLPRRQIEFRAERLIPAHNVQVVVCDDDGRRAQLAAATVERMGYTRVAVLNGGINAWTTAGLPTEWGTNVLSKDFGEKVEVRHHVPTIEAGELERRRLAGKDLIILDARTPEEYQRFCIPGGRSVPGGELALRITDIVRERPEATIVVNCAGRTRSIIGARVLQRMEVPRIMSLKNGTAGWLLAGLELEHGADRVGLPEPSVEGIAAAEAYARRVADEDGIRYLSVQELKTHMARAELQPLYLIDVRTGSEYDRGHIPGFWWFPGGQAVQRADDVVAVPNATIVFCCDGIVRSSVTASWYRQMGFANVFAVEGGVAAWQSAGNETETGPAEAVPFGLEQAAASVAIIEPAALQSARDRERQPLIIAVDPSDEFARGHIPAARWIPRGWLEFRIGALASHKDQPIVISDRDGRQALLSAATLKGMGYRDVGALAGGTHAWSSAGLPLDTGLSGVMHAPDDVLAMGPERSSAAAIEYLRWEEALGQKYA